jgi:hypothetical protein
VKTEVPMVQKAFEDLQPGDFFAFKDMYRGGATNCGLKVTTRGGDVAAVVFKMADGFSTEINEAQRLNPMPVLLIPDAVIRPLRSFGGLDSALLAPVPPSCLWLHEKRPAIRVLVHRRPMDFFVDDGSQCNLQNEFERSYWTTEWEIVCPRDAGVVRLVQSWSD